MHSPEQETAYTAYGECQDIQQLFWLSLHQQVYQPHHLMSCRRQRQGLTKWRTAHCKRRKDSRTSWEPEDAQVHRNCVCRSWRNWQMKLLSHYPVYLRSHVILVRFPWKKGNIFHNTFSKREKTEGLGSYRSVSLTLMPKIMHHILLKTMLRHIENKEVTGDSQYGFSNGKLCLQVWWPSRKGLQHW